MYEVKVIADSMAPCGKRLTTMTATYPRFIHSEFLTHRDRARNAASSRAIPWSKMRQQVMENPVIPLVFGSEQKGMQTGGSVDDPRLAERTWLAARDEAILHADQLHKQGVHKSLVNRIVEPWMWITIVTSATEWENFFRLRCHSDAEVHFQKIAGMVRDALAVSQPIQRFAGDWHLPFVYGNDLDELLAGGQFTFEDIKKISVARCARVSYLSHEGKRDPVKDIELFDKLVQGSGFGHWSAHEHVAMALRGDEGPLLRSGPFIGWKQYRKCFATENLAG